MELQDSGVQRAKIELAIGNLRFSGEGDQDWLEQQINKLIDMAPQMEIAPPSDSLVSNSEPRQNNPVSTESLATYLKAKDGDSKQVQRFLATAGWLWGRGERTLTTHAVTKALQDNQQKRLSNSAECLNRNVARGFCEKTKGGFFITSEGWRQLGVEPA